MKSDIIEILLGLALVSAMLYAAVDSNNKQEYVKPKLAEYCKPLIECEK